MTSTGRSYTALPYDDLLVYAVREIIRVQERPTFERIVAKCFELFPERFALRGYPQWPDSAVVNKSWLRCRTDKHLITGSVREGFYLTPRGEHVAEAADSRLNGGRVPSSQRITRRTEERTQEGRLLGHIESTGPFREFVTDGVLRELSAYEITDVLLATTETGPHVLRSNLDQMKYAADIYKRSDLISFLSELEAQLDHWLRLQAAGEYVGGMHRRRTGREEESG